MADQLTLADPVLEAATRPETNGQTVLIFGYPVNTPPVTTCPHDLTFVDTRDRTMCAGCYANLTPET